MSILTTIATLPDAPSRQSPSTFADDGDEFLGALPSFGNEVNTVGIEINSTATIINGYKTAAATSASNAAASVSSTSTYASNAASSAATCSSNADSAASNAAFIGSLYALVGIGLDSDGFLFAEINDASNITNLALDASGNLIATYT